jgi:hypothetical protein
MERRHTRLGRQLTRAMGPVPVVAFALGLGLVLAGAEAPPPERAAAAVEMALNNPNALDEAARQPLVALPAGAMPLAGLWIMAGGLGWAGFGAWRAASAVRAARGGEVREARVTAHARAGRRRGAPRRLAWRDARGQRGQSRPRSESALEPWPVGSVVVVYADPLTGRGWWEEDL